MGMYGGNGNLPTPSMAPTPSRVGSSGVQGLLGAAGGLAYANEISKRGQGYAKEMGELAGQLQNDAGFKGYGVNTGLAN